MSDQFDRRAIFVLPDGETITAQLLSKLKLHGKKPEHKIVVVWGAMKA